MKVRVLFFGATADVVGARIIETDVAVNSSPTTIVESLAAEHPELKKHRLLFAINERYVDKVARLADGDDLAIFTAVSGG